MEENIKHTVNSHNCLAEETSNFIKVWLSVYISLCYCYVAAKVVPKGVAARLLAFFPIVCLFFFLPLNLHSVHLVGITSFFVTWLANFKLLLFVFGKGPLSDPSISLHHFVTVACLPIKVQQQNNENAKTVQNERNSYNSVLAYATKGVLIGIFLKIFDCSEYIHPKVILVFYCFHIYFTLELALAIAAAFARGLLGVELEPQFNEPILSTSLQDFWGRRWNLMVTSILRPTVYKPVVNFSTRILGRKWARIPAIMSTYMVSGLMHELIFYYLGREQPTWETTWFFLLHGVCLVGEIAAKKALRGRFHVPRIIGRISTVGFVLVTALWLFLPQLLRCGVFVRGLKEYAAVGAFLKDLAKALTFASTTSSNSTTSR